MPSDPPCSPYRDETPTLTTNISTIDFIREQLIQLLTMADEEGDHVLAAHISMALARADERLAVDVR